MSTQLEYIGAEHDITIDIEIIEALKKKREEEDRRERALKIRDFMSIRPLVKRGRREYEEFVGEIPQFREKEIESRLEVCEANLTEDRKNLRKLKGPITWLSLVLDGRYGIEKRERFRNFRSEVAYVAGFGDSALEIGDVHTAVWAYKIAGIHKKPYFVKRLENYASRGENEAIDVRKALRKFGLAERSYKKI